MCFPILPITKIGRYLATFTVRAQRAIFAKVREKRGAARHFRYFPKETIGST
jgi:hypothetical protein